MIHNLFPNEVYLEPIQHKYFDSKGNQYISFSALYGKLVKKFDANKIAGMYKDKSKEDVLAMWQAQTDSGTRIDNALERYAQTATVLETDEDLRELLPVVLEKYKDFNSTYEQGVVYSKEYMVAGSWDKMSIVSNRKDSRFQLSDFKAFEKGFDSLFTISGSDKWLNAPLSHLPANKYTKISLQLSFYSYLFEELTGRKCERLFIDLITPVTEKGRVVSFTNQVVPVNYLKNDIKLFLDYYKDDIKDMLDETENAVYESDDNEIF